MPPTPASPGYGPPQVIAWNGDADASALRAAMKGFGTDEKALIRALADKDPLQVEVIRNAYQRMQRRDLEQDVKSETNGWLEAGLLAIIRGPLMHDVHMLHEAMSGAGTNERVLNDVLLSRTNADLRAIKSAYARVYGRQLEDVVKGDLSMKTERHFLIALGCNRAEDAVPVTQQQVEQDTLELYKATEGRMGTDEILVCNILTTRNDAQIRAIAQAYEQKFRRTLEDVIKKVSLLRPTRSLPSLAHTFILTPPRRNSPATWKTRFCSSCATRRTSTCTRRNCSRMPCRARGRRILSSSRASSASTGTASSATTSAAPTDSGTDASSSGGSRVRRAATTRS